MDKSNCFWPKNIIPSEQTKKQGLLELVVESGEQEW